MASDDAETKHPEESASSNSRYDELNQMSISNLSALLEQYTALYYSSRVNEDLKIHNNYTNLIEKTDYIEAIIQLKAILDIPRSILHPNDDYTGIQISFKLSQHKNRLQRQKLGKDYTTHFKIPLFYYSIRILRIFSILVENIAAVLLLDTDLYDETTIYWGHDGLRTIHRRY